MASLTGDAEKVKEAGENLKAIAKDYNLIIEELYEKINNIQSNNVWASESAAGSANKFIEKSLKDKPNHQNLATSMDNLGNKIVSYGNRINKIADNTIQ